MIQILVLIIIIYLFWLVLGPITIIICALGALLVGGILLSLGIYALLVLCRFIGSGIKLRSAQKLLDECTSKEYLATLTPKQRRALGKLVELYHNNKKGLSGDMKEVALWSVLGWTAADLGPSRALRYSLGYYGLRKMVRDKFTSKEKGRGR